MIIFLLTGGGLGNRMNNIMRGYYYSQLFNIPMIVVWKPHWISDIECDDLFENSEKINMVRNYDVELTDENTIFLLHYLEG